MNKLVFNDCKMKIYENVSLLPYNTFKVESKAAYFCTVRNVADLQEILTQKWLEVPKLIIGGGSNILLTGNFSGLVLLNRIKGISIIQVKNRFFFDCLSIASDR